jgi:hypothetical protein
VLLFIPRINAIVMQLANGDFSSWISKHRTMIKSKIFPATTLRHIALHLAIGVQQTHEAGILMFLNQDCVIAT